VPQLPPLGGRLACLLGSHKDRHPLVTLSRGCSSFQHCWWCPASLLGGHRSCNLVITSSRGFLGCWGHLARLMTATGTAISSLSNPGGDLQHSLPHHSTFLSQTRAGPSQTGLESSHHLLHYLLHHLCCLLSPRGVPEHSLLLGSSHSPTGQPQELPLPCHLIQGAPQLSPLLATPKNLPMVGQRGHHLLAGPHRGRPSIQCGRGVMLYCDLKMGLVCIRILASKLVWQYQYLKDQISPYISFYPCPLDNGYHADISRTIK
jgi:hypothetical protein